MASSCRATSTSTSSDDRPWGLAVEFGVVLQPNPPASRVIDLARKAEAAGFRGPRSARRGRAEGGGGEPHGKRRGGPWGRGGAWRRGWRGGYGPKGLRRVGAGGGGCVLRTGGRGIGRWTFGSVQAAAEAA